MRRLTKGVLAASVALAPYAAVTKAVYADTKPLVVNIDNPNFRKLVMAIPTFVTEPNADEQTKKLAVEATEELTRLVNFCGLFNVMSPAAYQELVAKAGFKTSDTNLEGIDFPQWKGLGIESLTVGAITKEGDSYVISGRTADVLQNKRIIGKRYNNTKAPQVKEAVRRYADRLLEAYTGKPGIFSTKLAFVGRTGKKAAKQIFVSDFDGSNAQQITAGNAPKLSPSWSHDGRFIVYTSFEDGDPDLFSYELATGRKKKLSGRKGVDSGGNFAPNDKLVAFTGANEGDTDIYVIPSSGGSAKPLIRGNGLDVDPMFSPNGKWIAFVSGRFGNPHIFVAELKWDGDTPKVMGDKRLTYAGWYNATPTWSPESDKLVFQGYDKDIDRWDIFMMNPDGTNLERLTIRAGDNERPSFSPNGQMLVFHSNRTPGRDAKAVPQLFVMNRDGSNQRPLGVKLYESQTPQWGPPTVD